MVLRNHTIHIIVWNERSKRRIRNCWTCAWYAITRFTIID